MMKQRSISRDDLEYSREEVDMVEAEPPGQCSFHHASRKNHGYVYIVLRLLNHCWHGCILLKPSMRCRPMLWKVFQDQSPLVHQPHSLRVGRPHVAICHWDVFDLLATGVSPPHGHVHLLVRGRCVAHGTNHRQLGRQVS